MSMKTIAVFPNSYKVKSALILDRIIEYSLAHRDELRLVMPQNKAEYFGHPELSVDNIYQKGNGVNYGLTIGGDGTLLGVCRNLYSLGVPACGINIGTVGFLADIEVSEVENKLDLLLSGKYIIVEVIVLHASILRNGRKQFIGHALNDVVITKGAVSRMLHLGISVNGYRVSDYKADGVIVSTPIGSTAYSLSAGGPIVHPGVEAILVTPICPHTFSFRPMVVGHTETICVHIAAVHQDIQVTLDGQENYPLQPGDDVYIRKAMEPAQLIKFVDKNYYSTLRHKLWDNI